MHSWLRTRLFLIPAGRMFGKAESVCTPGPSAVTMCNRQQFPISEINVIGPYTFLAVESVSSLADRWYRPNSKKGSPKFTLLEHT